MKRSIPPLALVFLLLPIGCETAGGPGATQQRARHRPLDAGQFDQFTATLAAQVKEVVAREDLPAPMVIHPPPLSPENAERVPVALDFTNALSEEMTRRLSGVARFGRPFDEQHELRSSLVFQTDADDPARRTLVFTLLDQSGTRVLLHETFTYAGNPPPVARDAPPPAEHAAHEQPLEPPPEVEPTPERDPAVPPTEEDTPPAPADEPDVAETAEPFVTDPAEPVEPMPEPEVVEPLTIEEPDPADLRPSPPPASEQEPIAEPDPSVLPAETGEKPAAETSPPGVDPAETRGNLPGSTTEVAEPQRGDPDPVDVRAPEPKPEPVKEDPGEADTPPETAPETAAIQSTTKIDDDDEIEIDEDAETFAEHVLPRLPFYRDRTLASEQGEVVFLDDDWSERFELVEQRSRPVAGGGLRVELELRPVKKKRDVVLRVLFLDDDRRQIEVTPELEYRLPPTRTRTIVVPATSPFATRYICLIEKD